MKFIYLLEGQKAKLVIKRKLFSLAWKQYDLSAKKPNIWGLHSWESRQIMPWHAFETRILEKENKVTWLHRFKSNYQNLSHCSRSLLNKADEPWISKRCFTIFVKKFLVQCVLTFTQIQSTSHVFTVSVCNAWNTGTDQVTVETQSDARNAKLLAECLIVVIWKIFPPVFTWTAWLMCWPLKNAKPAKLDVETVKRRAPRVLIVSSVACFGVKSASLHITSFKSIKITVF